MRTKALRTVFASTLAAAGFAAGLLPLESGGGSRVAHAQTTPTLCRPTIGPLALESGCATWYQRYTFSVQDCTVEGNADSVTARITNQMGGLVEDVVLTNSFADYWFGTSSCLGPEADYVTFIASNGLLWSNTVSYGDYDCGCGQ